MEEILHQLIWSISHNLQGFICTSQAVQDFFHQQHDPVFLYLIHGLLLNLLVKKDFTASWLFIDFIWIFMLQQKHQQRVPKLACVKKRGLKDTDFWEIVDSWFGDGSGIWERALPHPDQGSFFWWCFYLKMVVFFKSRIGQQRKTLVVWVIVLRYI